MPGLKSNSLEVVLRITKTDIIKVFKLLEDLGPRKTPGKIQNAVSHLADIEIRDTVK